MILKDKQATYTINPRLDAGIKQELDVAFYLRRAYKNSPSVMVFNDLVIHYDDETAQIDHLVLYKYGFIIIESKSIKGHVIVNAQAEWTRSVGNQWVGMPSPIRQAELQADLLARFLCNHRAQMVGKLLGIQMSLGGRCYDTLCAISSDAIIDRSNAPADVTGRLVKSEFIVDAITKVMNEIKPWNIIGRIKDTRPTFSKDEMRKISDFLLASQAEPQISTFQKNYYGAGHVSPIDLVVLAAANAPPLANAVYTQCKHCGETHWLQGASGLYGYYVKCGACNKNTPLKRPCSNCQSRNTKVKRRERIFRVHCADCQHVAQYANVC